MGLSIFLNTFRAIIIMKCRIHLHLKYSGLKTKKKMFSRHFQNQIETTIEKPLYPACVHILCNLEKHEHDVVLNFQWKNPFVTHQKHEAIDPNCVSNFIQSFEIRNDSMKSQSTINLNLYVTYTYADAPI